ncbi:MAG: hypothetical protein HFJ24_05035 [Clostridia bacterium]|nr:hypothetical protein [Clostridia bacterium]MCI9275329.1 hypothetical protein [Clostridia bacterium]
MQEVKKKCDNILIDTESFGKIPRVTFLKSKCNTNVTNSKNIFETI